MDTKETKKDTKALDTQIPINPGNIEILTVKMLSEIVQQLKRIANSLEAK